MNIQWLYPLTLKNPPLVREICNFLNVTPMQRCRYFHSPRGYKQKEYFKNLCGPNTDPKFIDYLVTCTIKKNFPPIKQEQRTWKNREWKRWYMWQNREIQDHVRTKW